MQRHFERSEGYIKAAAEEKQAYADYTTARQKAISTVAGDPKYHPLCMLRDELADQIAAKRHAKNVGLDEIAVMATLKMQYASDARAMEVSAMTWMTEVKAARGEDGTGGPASGPSQGASLRTRSTTIPKWLLATT